MLENFTCRWEDPILCLEHQNLKNIWTLQKREDTLPMGSHKLNFAIPQAYFAKKEGIERLNTETGAGRWGTVLSLACNLLDLECTVYMVKVSFQQMIEKVS